MVKVIFDKKFESFISKIKDNLLKEKVIKQIDKIIAIPDIGKPMRFSRKGTREVYVGSFRISYIFHVEQGTLEFLDFYHKDEQ